MVNKIAFIIVFACMLPLTTMAQSCSWIENNACPQNAPTIGDISKCQNKKPMGLCCCEPEPAKPAVAPKYIIIGSLVIVFGIITVLSFVLKKNEYEQ